VNISAEAKLTETCFYLHKRVLPPLNAAFPKCPLVKLIAYPCPRWLSSSKCLPNVKSRSSDDG